MNENINYSPLSKNDLTNVYKNWADTIKKIEFEILSASDEKDYRFITKLVEQYCGYDYRHLNNYLRFDIDTTLNDYREKSHLLTLLIYLAPRIQQNFFVYRSVCPEFIDRLLNDGRAWEKGFMSTTFDLNYACNYCDENSVIKINVKSNTPCVFVDIIKDRGESELLFPPCGALELTTIPTKKGANKKLIYECNLFYF